LAAAFPFVAQAIPVQINLTNDGLPLIPPAVAYTMGEFERGSTLALLLAATVRRITAAAMANPSGVIGIRRRPQV
jgi:hypothetical protein